MNSMIRVLIVLVIASNTFAMKKDSKIQEIRKRRGDPLNKFLLNHTHPEFLEIPHGDMSKGWAAAPVCIAPKKQSLDHKYASIYEAAKANDPIGLESFLDEVDVNEYNQDGDTPLHCAVDFFAAAAIRSLILMGADLDKKDEHGKFSALELAVRYNDTPPIQNPVACRAIEKARAEKANAEKVRQEGGVLVQLAPLKEYFEKYAQDDSALLPDATAKQTVLRRSERIKKFLEKAKK